MRKTFQFTIFIFSMFNITTLFFSCGSNDSEKDEVKADAKETKTENKKDIVADNGKGIGPIKSIELGSIDDAKAKAGEKIFDVKCGVCHNITKKKLVGPGLSGVTERRKPEWIMNQILNPLEMTQKDPTSKKLLATYTAQMTDQGLTKDEARNVLEYFRKSDKEDTK